MKKRITGKLSITQLADFLKVDRSYLKEIVKSKNISYVERSKTKFYSLKEVQKAIKKYAVTLYEPVYITQTFFIKESKLNYTKLEDL
jgi:transposase-like protein